MTGPHTNRLIHETSPYLMQHAHNPVDWYAWGPEAFEAARSQDKPIFLSVGYSTCYWCHVMERESFENEFVAREMNQRFINIKVDREERPDVDQLYMTAVQVLTHHGGWPMSVFLMPDLRPFYGGTYFPPTDAHGRPGFVTILRAIEDAYRNRKREVEQSAEQLQQILEQLAEPEPPDHPIVIDENFIEKLIERSTSDFDPVNGGFGSAPKFPRETLLALLLKSPKDESRLTKTLDAIAAGGIRDHLGGGFHRYSTDAKWLVPHFEIMLYDNAMLAWIYRDAADAFHEPRYLCVARGITDFVMREMTSPDGAFFTAIDAEVDAHEGDPYLWTPAEVVEVLGERDAELFNRVYGLNRGFNFADPHGQSHTPDRNVLFLAEPSDDPSLPQLRDKLYQARRKRKQPRTDTKIITSWNALMIRALNFVGEWKAAHRAADYLWTHHRKPDGTLYRSSRDGQARYDGFLDDYAFFAQALLSIGRRKEATQIVDMMVQKFAAPDGGFYFSATGADDLIVRQMVGSDSPLPAGAAVAASVLIELDRHDEARRIFEGFASQLERNAESMSAMLQAAQQYVRAHGPIDVAAGEMSKRPRSPQQLAADVVTLRAAWESPTTLHVIVQIRDDFHINSNTPAEQMIATRLDVVGEADARVEYPPGTTYSHEVDLTVRFGSKPSSQQVRMALTYQACDASACLPVVTRQFEVPVG